MDRKIPYGRQHIRQEDINAVVEVLKSDFLTTGPKVKEFEDKFSSYVGSKYAVAVANGTAALHLCAMAVNVDENTRVITSPITFSASANCVRYCGGQIDFCDIDPETLLIDIVKLEEKLSKQPIGTYSGIIPVDFAGYPNDLEKLKDLANRYGLWIIEDACHAPGAWFVDKSGKKQKSGNGAFADLAIFSFHPVKHIACGEGGMITTNNEDLYDRLLRLRSHGMVYQGNPDLIENHGKWYMEIQELGYNYRMPDILCALGISQLEFADEGLTRRKEIASKYDLEFKNLPIMTHPPKKDIGHAYHLYVVEVDKRKELYDILREKGIYTQIHYIPVHMMPYYRSFGHKKGDYPIAERYYDRCISLPMYPSLTDEEQEYVIEQVIQNIDG